MSSYFLHIVEMNLELRVTEAFGNKSVQEIADAMAVNYATLDHWLKGRREIPIVRLVQISAFTGVSIHWLVTGRGPKFVESPVTPPTSPPNPEQSRPAIQIGTLTGSVGAIGGEGQVVVNNHVSNTSGKVTEKQANYLKNLMDNLGRLLTEREGSNGFGLAMSGFKRKFKIDEIKNLPSDEMDEALAYLKRRIKAVEADLRDEGFRK